MKTTSKHLLITYFGFVLLFGITINMNAQSVGINTENIPTDAVLHIYSDPSNPKGLIIPRLTTEQRNTMTVSSEGLSIYNTTSHRFEMWNGNAWTGMDGGLWNPGENNDIWQIPRNVGIGTAAPSTHLHILSKGDRVLHLQRSGNSGSQITFQNQNHIINFGLDRDGGFGFAKAGDPYGEMLGVEKDKPGEVKVNGQVGGIVPKGGIIMWSGDPSTIPDGWALCDGRNGTPDLKGKFVVGYDPAHADYNEVTKTGGEDRVKLSVTELPPHTHSFSATTNTAGGHTHTTSIGKNCCGNDKGHYLWEGGYAGNKSYTSSYSGDHRHTVSGTTATNTNGGASHENRPSYYVIAYIIKR